LAFAIFILWVIFNIFYMSNSIFDTPEGRKAAFMMLYKQQKYDIVEIAKELDISVIPDETMPNEALGFIRYKNNKFEIVVNNNKKIDKPTTDARVVMTIAHEVAHWIYDYDDMTKNGEVFCETESLNISDKRELIASVVASNIILGINEPLVDEKRLNVF
jgi:Zn-dependent peptidase ImmA (M78 family)